MPTRILEPIPERSTVIFDVEALDENKLPTLPVTARWSLLRMDGSYVNNRQNVALAPATIMPVVLSGEDLRLWPNDHGIRRLLVEVTYDSDAGEGLPATAEAEFRIENLIGIPNTNPS